MSTPFLVRFTHAVLQRLVDSGLIEIAPGSETRVVESVARHLATEARGGSVLSGLETALLRCDDVVELYADLDQLKRLVEELR